MLKIEKVGAHINKMSLYNAIYRQKNQQFKL